MDRNTANFNTAALRLVVALHRSAWIEIGMYANGEEVSVVALHRSAWIEIFHLRSGAFF